MSGKSLDARAVGGMDEHSVSFPAETMPNGKSYPAKCLVGVQAVLDEMQLRNGRPWKQSEEEEMRRIVAMRLSGGECGDVH
jgi:hypothetical protein